MGLVLVTLARRTPLTRSGNLARSPLAPRSPRGRTRGDDRAAFVAAVLASRPWCEINASCPAGAPARACEVHEPWTRARGGPWTPAEGLTASRCWPTCRPCHAWAHHPPAGGLESWARGGRLVDGAPCPWIIGAAEAGARGWSKTPVGER